MRIPNYLQKNWKKFTLDKHILGVATNGLKLDFKGFPKDGAISVQNIKE